jgi:hypothetical protein
MSVTFQITQLKNEHILLINAYCVCSNQQRCLFSISLQFTTCTLQLWNDSICLTNNKKKSPGAHLSFKFELWTINWNTHKAKFQFLQIKLKSHSFKPVKWNKEQCLSKNVLLPRPEPLPALLVYPSWYSFRLYLQSKTHKPNQWLRNSHMNNNNL